MLPELNIIIWIYLSIFAYVPVFFCIRCVQGNFAIFKLHLVIYTFF